MLNLANNFLWEILNSFDSDKLEDLDLIENQFLGYISHSFKNLSMLMQLKLSNGKLYSNIPE